MNCPYCSNPTVYSILLNTDLPQQRYESEPFFVPDTATYFERKKRIKYKKSQVVSRLGVDGTIWVSDAICENKTPEKKKKGSVLIGTANRYGLFYIYPLNEPKRGHFNGLTQDFKEQWKNVRVAYIGMRVEEEPEQCPDPFRRIGRGKEFKEYWIAYYAIRITEMGSNAVVVAHWWPKHGLVISKALESQRLHQIVKEFLKGAKAGPGESENGLDGITADEMKYNLAQLIAYCEKRNQENLQDELAAFYKVSRFKLIRYFDRYNIDYRVMRQEADELARYISYDEQKVWEENNVHRLIEEDEE
jgi:hypothetical protein